MMLPIRRVLAAAAGAVPRATALAQSCDASLQVAEHAGEPAVAAAREFNADLLVISPARDPVTQRLELSHADWQAVRHSPCPVLLARTGEARPYRQILVAVDPLLGHDKPAALDDALVAAARALVQRGREADAAGVRIELLHCYLSPEYLPLRAPGAAPAGILHGSARDLDTHRQALQQLACRHGIAEAAIRLEPGDAREAIADVAVATGADLVVLGAVSRGRIRQLLIGSTTGPAIGRLACDVLTVRPEPS